MLVESVDAEDVDELKLVLVEVFVLELDVSVEDVLNVLELDELDDRVDRVEGVLDEELESVEEVDKVLGVRDEELVTVDAVLELDDWVLDV